MAEHSNDELYGDLPPTFKEGNMRKESSAVQKSIGNLALKQIELTDNMLFDDAWERK